MSEVRVRFAPSPTGPLHIGGVRTALYNYLFAKKNGGTFILRIEDTDQTRFVEGAEDYIIDSLKWCGIKIDEGIYEGGEYGPYRQSDRKAIYRQYADMLIESGDAYYAFDTPEELEILRRESENAGNTFIYNGYIRAKLNNSLSLAEADWKSKLENGDPFVIRYKMPLNEDIHFDDLIRGDIVVNTSTLDDKVLYKSDGMPTYHLAHLVDDHLMKISHVIRGEEWLPSLPLHFMLYRSFKWDPPRFAHLPLLLKPDGKGKLSKRDGDKMGFPVFPVFWPYGETAKGYREEGYYPDAFVNMIALLGWNPGTEQEIFSMDQLIEAFTIERVGKSGSRFDPEKAKWFNHQYLQTKPDDQIAIEFREFLRAKGFHFDIVRLETLIALVKERVNFVKEIWDQTDYFFKAPELYDQEVIKKRWKDDTPARLMELRAVLEECEDFSVASTEGVVKSWIENNGYNTGAIMNAFRLVIVGASRGPHMFDIISWIGKDETLQRIDKGIAVIGNISK
ncbi:MAG: glutamate--tRNA ligase [Bacteroidetes bacterium GWE2_41_25]|nr:MAG: glutamate--tRNA ligase [Bacteroidetes bacterium GWA2_40_15]OFX92270.1 MAG: glutamate--tRNA ligase [Bacteroidetes bacterium GWE2_41_25]OFX99882.1 MAG: glutamate--tRNA ligase [Bacteroidetes bacterium GWC2_40_22]OFY57487.1 MAG: glutamate--tRNA ligase [Bacteroidetes bacterium GWF2_41_9]